MATRIQSAPPAAALGAFKAAALLRGWIDDDRCWIDDDRCWTPLSALSDAERHAIAERLKIAGVLA